MKQQLFKNVGRFLRQRRIEIGLTQRQVSEKLGYGSPQFISDMERGLCTLPLKKLGEIVKLYKLAPQELMELMLQEQEAILRDALMPTAIRQRTRATRPSRSATA